MSKRLSHYWIYIITEGYSFGYNSDPLLFTKTQVNKLLHLLIEEDWWKKKREFTINLPHRRFELEEFDVRKVHNQYRKIAKKYEIKIPHVSKYPGHSWIEINNAYNIYKATLLSQMTPSSAYDWSKDKYFVKDYIEKLRATF